MIYENSPPDGRASLDRAYEHVMSITSNAYENAIAFTCREGCSFFFIRERSILMKVHKKIEFTFNEKHFKQSMRRPHRSEGRIDMDSAEKERRSRRQPHRVYSEQEERGWCYREHPPSYGEMLEDGFGAIRRNQDG